MQYSFAQSQVRPNQFAIFRTHNPWGNILLRNHITADGYTYSIFGPPALVGFPFADYRVVVLDWSDTESIDFDPPYTSVIPALETYISNGGVVWIQGAIQNGVFPLPFAGRRRTIHRTTTLSSTRAARWFRECPTHSKAMQPATPSSPVIPATRTWWWWGHQQRGAHYAL